MARGIRTLSARPGQGYGQVVQAPAVVHPVPLEHPDGQLTVPHDPVPQVAMQEQESLQSTFPHPPLPLQLTVQAPLLQLTLSHALEPSHVTWQAVSSLPQSTLPHALGAVQLITHDTALWQSIDEHAPDEPQLIVQA